MSFWRNCSFKVPLHSWLIVPKALEDRKQHEDWQSQFSLNPTPDSGFRDSCELMIAAGFCISRKTKDSVDVCVGSCQQDHSGNMELGKLFPSTRSSATSVWGNYFKPISCNLRVNFALLEPIEPLINSPGVCYPLTTAALAYNSYCIPDIQLG